jgi:hypothetical protein
MLRCRPRDRPSLDWDSLVTFCNFPDAGCTGVLGALRLLGIAGDRGAAADKAFGLVSSAGLACVLVDSVRVVGGSMLGASGAARGGPDESALFGREWGCGCSTSECSLPERSRGAKLALAFPFRGMRI